MLQKPVPAGKVRFVEVVPNEEDVTTRRIEQRNHQPDLAKQIQALLEDDTVLRIPARTRYRAVPLEK